MERTCEQCKEPFRVSTGRGRPRRKCETCSPPERRNEPRPVATKAWTTPRPAARPKPEPAPVAPPPEVPRSAVADATRQALADAGREDTPLGAIALQLAQMLGTGDHAASGAAALSKELRTALAEALAGAEKQADSVDEITQRRLRKAANA